MVRWFLARLTCHSAVCSVWSCRSRRQMKTEPLATSRQFYSKTHNNRCSDRNMEKYLCIVKSSLGKHRIWCNVCCFELFFANLMRSVYLSLRDPAEIQQRSSSVSSAGSLLNCPSCSPDDPISQGTDLNILRILNQTESLFWHKCYTDLILTLFVLWQRPHLDRILI